MDNSSKAIHKLTILNWNANGIKSQRALFISFLARHSVDIACITETHLSEGETFKISGYQIYRTDRITGAAWGGVAIMIKQQLQHSTPIDIPTINLETITVNISTSNTNPILITAAYKQPNKPLKDADIQNLFNSTSPTLVIGDLNSKSTYWGCRTNNPSGTKLNNYTVIHQLQIYAPSEYTYYPYRRDHLPDILDIIVAKNFCIPIQQSVIPELDSDHLPVLITFTSTPIVRQLNPRMIKGFVNWELFQQKLDSQLTNPSKLENTLDVDTHIEALTSTINNSIQSSTKPFNNRKAINPNIPPAYILDLINQKSRTRRRWQRTKEPPLKNQLNNLTRKIRREIEKYRIFTYRKYIENIEPGSTDLWKATKQITRTKETIPTLETQDATYSTDEEKSNLFAKHLENIFTPSISEENRMHFHRTISYIETHQPIPDDFTQPASPSEIGAYIQNLSLKKLPAMI